MPQRAAIVETENMFPQGMAECHARPWGVLFYNEDIPESHDCNHALVTRPEGHLAEVVAEIVAFYRERRLIPRLYQAFANGETERLVPVLEEAGFTVRLYDNTTFTWAAPNALPENPAVEVRRVREVDHHLAGMLLPEEGGLRIVKVLRRQLRHESMHLLVAHADGQPVSMAALEVLPRASRVDHVLTPEPFRNHGYARAVIRALVDLHGRVSGNLLYLCADNPVAIRIYEAAGFRAVPLDMQWWSAWRE